MKLSIVFLMMALANQLSAQQAVENTGSLHTLKATNIRQKMTGAKELLTMNSCGKSIHSLKQHEKSHIIAGAMEQVKASGSTRIQTGAAEHNHPHPWGGDHHHHHISPRHHHLRPKHHHMSDRDDHMSSNLRPKPHHHLRPRHHYRPRYHYRPRHHHLRRPVFPGCTQPRDPYYHNRFDNHHHHNRRHNYGYYPAQEEQQQQKQHRQQSSASSERDSEQSSESRKDHKLHHEQVSDVNHRTGRNYYKNLRREDSHKSNSANRRDRRQAAKQQSSFGGTRQYSYSTRGRN